ncbi:MAG: zinc-binding dehydrogenase [Deltaproteobacteria bacterium]|nr:zinc-binding dehydrogenase [Deltaproteobacteria bacterium]MCW5802360.1 zinc-binding dehydrogenase [Deltaproteobacteria bacterium]
MRAAVIAAPHTCEVKEVDTPEPSPDEVLVQVEGCGVCGSNLPAWEGRPWFTYPLPPGRPGHEGWGRVVATGRNVRSFAPGNRVAFLSDHAFSEYDVADARSVIELPRALDHDDVPGEPLGCALNIWKRSEIAAGQTVAVVGIGFLGAILVQLAARAGARVIAVSQRDYSLALATKLGAAEALHLDGAERASESCDRVIELVGLQRPLDVAARLCRVRGRLVIAGFHQDGPREVDMFLWNWRGLDVINAHERDPLAYVAGINAAIDRVVSGELDPRPLYTDRIPLSRAGDAFELLRRRPSGFVKALVVP